MTYEERINKLVKLGMSTSDALFFWGDVCDDVKELYDDAESNGMEAATADYTLERLLKKKRAALTKLGFFKS